jgi:hypothetical protein
VPTYLFIGSLGFVLAWGYVMHVNRERRLRVSLLRHGGPDIVVATVPWQLQVPEPESVIAEEEPAPVGAGS